MRSEQCPYYKPGVCPPYRTVVEGEGDPDSPLMIIGEAPGVNEDNEGRPFVGDSGLELNRLYLRQAGMRREHAYITNVVKCLPQSHGDSNTPSPELVAHCSHHILERELLKSRARVILTLGGVASRRMGILDPVESVSGCPVRMGTRWVVPSIHPAAPMHDQKRASVLMVGIIRAFSAAGSILRGETPVEDVIDPCYVETDMVCPELLGGIVALDTESDASGLRIVSWCSEPGVAFCTWNREAMTQLAYSLRGREVVMHNAPYDLRVLRAAGIDTRQWKVQDTMLAAYSLRTLPLGLKAMARVIAGMSMESYEEVVERDILDNVLIWSSNVLERLYPDEIPVAGTGIRVTPPVVRGVKESLKSYRARLLEERDSLLDWYIALRRDSGAPFLVDCGWEHRTLREVLDVVYKHPVSSQLRRVLKNLASKRSKSDAYDAIAGLSDSARRVLESVSPWPADSLDTCDRERVNHYACRDADATFRVWNVLRGEVVHDSN